MRISDCSSVVCSSDLPDINFLLGDDLLDGGHTLEAAQEYSKTAYGYRAHIKAPEAAYAAVLAYQKYAKEVPADQRPQALKLAIDESLKLADTYPSHAQRNAVLTQTADEDRKSTRLNSSH